MAQKNVRFVATKTVKKPATVKFKTKSGKTVSFRAVKTFERKQAVRFRAKKYHSGVGDVIHSVIMKNNGISQILTFDERDDFKQIPDLTVLHPRDIKIQD